MASLFFLITSGGHSGSLAENSIPERRVLRSLTFPQQLSERIQINGTDIRSTPNQSRLDPKIDISLFSGTWKESPRWNRIRGHRITFFKKKKVQWNPACRLASTSQWSAFGPDETSTTLGVVA